jgi:hypothetical protein
MNGSDWGPHKFPLGWIAFGIPFIAISSLLCLFAHISVVVYFALLFLSVLIALVVSSALLTWFERYIDGMLGRYTERRKRDRPKSRAYWHW